MLSYGTIAMKVVVTGGAGFIGSHVCEGLLGCSHEVSIIDELNDFYPPEFKRANLETVRRRGPVDILEADICDEERVAEAFRRWRPDAVIHLAARAGVRPSVEDPLLYERVNVRGTLTLLEACRRFEVPKLVFASSSSVYGINSKVPFREDDRLDAPISPYAATKIAGEKLCSVYAHLYGLKVACLRLFTVYGPRQRPDLAIRKFISKIDAGVAIPVYGDGNSGRDYTYVQDTVSGILAALECDCRFEVFNLGNSHPVRLHELIATIEQAVGRKARIERLPNQAGDVPITYADISKAAEQLGYAPRTSLKQGIEETVDWVRALPS